MIENLRKIIREICSLGCNNCVYDQSSKECKKQLNEYEKRIREAIKNEQT